MNMYHNNAHRVYHQSQMYSLSDATSRKHRVQNGNNYTLPHYQSNQDYWCETCDKGFFRIEQLNSHKLQHQRCNIDGCEFIAHPKVITKHIQMQHSTGLYSKISRLSDPEEINKWREERKMKYPTKDNIARKTAELLEKMKRGEKMGLQKFRNTCGTKTKLPMKNNHRNRKHKTRTENHTNAKVIHTDDNLQKNNKRELTKPTGPLENHDVKYYGLKPFSGIQDLIFDEKSSNTEEHIECVLDIDDSEWTENISHLPNEKEKNDSCNALSNLITNYDSDSNSEHEIPHHNNDSKETHKCSLNNDDKLMKKVGNDNIEIALSDDSGPEEVTAKKEEETITNYTKEIKEVPKKQFRQHSKPIVQKYNKRKLPSTLLQKLLNQEMRHERNIALQCIRHIINNNFFIKDSIK